MFALGVKFQMKWKIYALIALGLSCENSFAQQPGTNAYNTRVLPAHGVGDTRSQPGRVWGAFAISPVNQWSGWVLTGSTQDEASLLAVSRCQEKGGLECKVSFTFADTCAAVAASGSGHGWSHGYSLQEVRLKAVDSCGDGGCKVVLEGCATSR
ncbi:MAG: DUF4189 domain-containing protein [Luteimonas sp.]